MRHVQGVELGHVPDGLELVNLVVAEPELLQRLPRALYPRQRLDQVPAQRQHPEILENLQILNVDNQVGREGEFLTVDKDVQGPLHLFYWGIHSNKFDLFGLRRFLSARLFPFLQGGLYCCWHISAF